MADKPIETIREMFDLGEFGLAPIVAKVFANYVEIGGDIEITNETGGGSVPSRPFLSKATNA